MLRLPRILAFLAICLPLEAGGQAHITKVLSTRDGLSNNFVVSLDMDSRGTLWIGTEEGMNSFDGVSVRNYLRNRGEIPGNALNQVYVDNTTERVWVATQREGLGAYDISGETPTFFFNRPGDESSIITREITGITRDPAGNIWFSTYARGVEKYDPQTGEFSHFNSTNVEGMPDHTIISLAAGSDGKIYLGHYGNGFTVLDPQERTAVNYTHSEQDPASLPSNRIGCVYIDKDNNIWVGTYRGIALFRPVTKDFKVFNQANSGIPDGLIFSILVTEEGYLLASPEYEGVWAADLDRMTGPDSFRLLPETEAVQNVGIRGMCEDAFGNLWLGTYGQGVLFLSRQPALFSELSFDGDLSEQSVSALQTMPSGDLIVGTQGGGLAIVDSNMVCRSSGLVISDKIVQAVQADSDGNYWIGTYSGATVKTDASFRTLFRLPFRDAKCFQEQGELMWVGTGSGLYAVRRRDGQVLSRYSDRDVLPENYLRSLCLDKRGRLWVGTFGAGIIVFDARMEPVSHFQTETGFSSNMINDLYAGGDGTVYAATGRGLVLFSTEDEKPSVSAVYGMEEGLGSEVIRAITEDPGRGVWFSTNLSVCHLDPATGTITEYRDFPGLPSGNYADHAVSFLQDGTLSFGSSAGLTWFNPRDVLDFDKEATVHFTELVFPRGDADTEARSLRLGREEQTVLNYRQNSFYLMFATDDYSFSDRVAYSYSLGGEEWLPTRTNFIYLSNLRPGKYLVSVRTRILNGAWSHPASAVIRIRPPFWRSLAAKLLYLFAGLLLLARLLRYLSAKARERNQRKLEQESIARIREANEERLRFYANITHELKTPLTLILGPAEDLGKDPSLPEDARRKVAVLVKNVKRLLDLTNRLLTFRKTETHNMALNVTYGNLSEIIQEIGSVFAESNTNKETLFTISVEPGVMTEFDREIVTIIVDNLLSNAMKFTPKGSVCLKLEKRSDPQWGEEAVISVEDTGYGIPKDQQNKIFERYYQVKDAHQAQGTGIGLSLVRSLVALHGGRIELDSEVGRGSIFRVCLPVRGLSGAGEALPEEPAAQPSDRAIVVVVEDDKDIRHYIRESLEETYSVFTAKNGNEGYKLVVKHIPDLVISDVMMPEMDGFSLCSLVKNDVRTCHIPVILLTAKDTMEDRSKGYRAGADSYLTKPFTSDMLLSRVGNLIESRERLASQFSTALREHRDLTGIQEQISKLDSEFLSRLTGLIRDNIGSDSLDVTFLADKMNMSTSTLYRKLKAVLGISTNRYIRKIRMQRAAELLSSGGCNVSEAAWQVGISDLLYFRQCFRDEFGVAPSDYRKHHA